MQHISARNAKDGFGKLIDLARAKPVAIKKYERLTGKTEPNRMPAGKARTPGFEELKRKDKRPASMAGSRV